MVLDASLLNTQHYKVRIKGKVEQSREGVAPSPTPWCSSYRKGNLRVTLDYGRQLTVLIYSLSFTLCYRDVHYVLSMNLRSYTGINMWSLFMTSLLAWCTPYPKHDGRCYRDVDIESLSLSLALSQSDVHQICWEKVGRFLQRHWYTVYPLKILIFHNYSVFRWALQVV